MVHWQRSHSVDIHHYTMYELKQPLLNKVCRRGSWLSHGNKEICRCCTQSWIWGVYCTQVIKHTSERPTTTLIQGRHHYMSKTEVSLAPQKGLMSAINFKKSKDSKLNYLKLYLVTSMSFLVPQDDRHTAISQCFNHESFHLYSHL